MYAIMELGGRQWKVEPGTRVEVNRLPLDVGASHTVDRVLLAQDGGQVKVGRPYVQGARIICEVLDHHLGPKTIAYHFRRRENWRKTVGHRQLLTRLLVKEIALSGEGAGTSSAAVDVQRPAPSTRASRTPSVKKTSVSATKPPRRMASETSPTKRGASHGA